MSFPDRHAYATHEVSNQPPALAGYDTYGSDPILRSIVKICADWANQPPACGGTVRSAPLTSKNSPAKQIVI